MNLNFHLKKYRFKNEFRELMRMQIGEISLNVLRNICR